MQLLRERIEENIKCRYEMSMDRQRAKEDDLPELEAWRERIECLLHRLDSDLARY